jgi:4-amino-4-deoxy-L-arabinose transferase-like glycosyltransferase
MTPNWPEYISRRLHILPARLRPDNEAMLFNLSATLVFLFALFVRALRANYGLPYIYYWDEPNLASTALQILKTGDYNPHFFWYGSLMIYVYLASDVLQYLYLVGQPDTARSHLAYLTDILINKDTGWYWTISHPSFYFVNRLINVSLGTGTVVLTYHLAHSVLCNRWFGLIAAIFLASTAVHVEFSALTTPDVPVAFFTTATVLFSLLFLDEGKIVPLAIALVSCGLAAATKYNSAIVIIVPATAIAVRRFAHGEAGLWRQIGLLIGVPPMIFVLVMPYAFFDMNHFLTEVGANIRIYKVIGWPGATSRPGISHVIFQLATFYHNIGMVEAIVTIIGFYGLLVRKTLMFTMIYPLVFFIFMTDMKVNFHRNFIQIYPFIALLFADGCMELLRLFTNLSSLTDRKRAIVAIFAGFVLVVVGVNSVATLQGAIAAHSQPDPRSELIDVINNMPEVSSLIVASDLRIHEEDLRRLTKPFAIKPVSELDACVPPGKIVALIIPANPISVTGAPESQVLAQSYRTLLEQLDSGAILARVGTNAFKVDGPGAPALIIAKVKVCS